MASIGRILAAHPPSTSSKQKSSMSSKSQRRYQESIDPWPTWPARMLPLRGPLSTTRAASRPRSLGRCTAPLRVTDGDGLAGSDTSVSLSVQQIDGAHLL
jgi:hypothetical protein